MVSTEKGQSCIICSLGKEKFPLDKYIMVIYLSLGKYKILQFPHPSSFSLTARQRDKQTDILNISAHPFFSFESDHAIISKLQMPPMAEMGWG